MKINKIIRRYAKVDVEILGITLLSKEEYSDSKKNIKPIENWWWLRSPSFYSSIMYNVGYFGDIDYNNVANPYGSVRPALIYKSNDLSIGERIYLSGKDWTVVSDKYILCDEEFCRMIFRKKWNANNANVYDASDVKKYLDDWFEHNIKEVNDETD